MRLNKKERDAIVSAIKKFDPAAEIWLFGSRTRDDLKGGDIDLLIVSEIIDFHEKIDILVDIKMKIGEQKIDLKILTPAAKQTDDFAIAVLHDAILLPH